MQKAAQSSQLKSGNLGGGRVYAFRVNRVNADYVCLKLWLLGGVIRARNIAVAALPDLIAQIDAALADGCEVITLAGAEFSAPEKVLSGIKKEFSYCCTHRGAGDGASRAIAAGATSPTAVFSSEKNLRSSPSNFCSKSRGGSDAKVLDSSANAQSKGATRTVRGAKQISEASAQAVCPKQPRTSSTRGRRSLPARQFNNHQKSGLRAFVAGSKSPAAAAATERPLRLKGRRPLRQSAYANESIPLSGVTDSRRKSRAVSCLREASISRCGGVKKARRPDTKKSPKPSGVAAEGNHLPKGWRKCNVENPPYDRVKTKHGRTSVVVATRKVS